MQRHQREIHGRLNNGRSVQQAFCPNPLCARHRKGFARQSNPKEHVKRVHGAYVGEMTANSPTLPNLSSQFSSSSISPANAEVLSGERNLEDFALTGKRSRNENNQLIDLQGNLEALKRQRARSHLDRRALDKTIRRLNEKIDLLEKTMQIMLPTSA